MAWTYNDLKTKVGQYLGRTDLSTQIDDAITLFESEYNTRKGVWRRQAVATITTTAGTDTADLPSDFERIMSINRVGFSAGITITSINALAPYRVGNGLPVYVAVYPNNKFVFAPTPDAAYTYELLYYPRLNGLTSLNTSNWLILNYSHVYLYGVLSYLLDYVQDLQRAQYIIGRHETNMAQLENGPATLSEASAVTLAEQSMP
jgi:hypothetical protein